MAHTSAPFGPTGQLNQQTIGTFHTEAGATINDVELAYHVYGTFRGEPDGPNNLILIEHALTGSSDVTEWWGDILGPGRALDTTRWCFVCINALGGCHGSTGPATLASDGKAWGSRFPALSIRDIVAAERQLLDQLGITHVHSVIGGSMGGARALEWSLMYPDRLGSICVLAVSARASGWQIGIQCAQISAIERDAHWHGGDYYGTGDFPVDGLCAARRIAHLTYRGEQEIDERFGATPNDGENPLGAYRDPQQRFSVNSYLEYQGYKLAQRFDAGSYVTLTEALNRHDIGRGRGGLNRALGDSTVPTMIIGVDTDILYPYHQQEHLSRNVGQLLGMAKIVSPVGHDAFLTETRQLNRIVRNYLELSVPEAYSI